MENLTLLLPLPPSENEIYRNVPGVGRAKTAEARKWQADLQSWAVRHNREFRNAREWAANLPHPGIVHVDCTFVFHSPRLWTKKGEPKRLDASNRLKALCDGLVWVLGTDDDCTMWAGAFEKAECERIEDQCAIITLQPFRPRKMVFRDGTVTLN